MVALVQDGIERRFAREGADLSMVFVELHELANRERSGPLAPPDPELVQLLPVGTTRAVQFLALWTAAEPTTCADLLWLYRMRPGEATEVYYLEKTGRSPGRILLGRTA